MKFRLHKGLIAGVAFFIASCAFVKRQKDKKDDGTDNAAQDCASDASECSADGEIDELTKYGLAEFCSFDAESGENQEGCFHCTPRVIPLVACRNVSATFNPEKDCIHDLDGMTCTLGINSIFEWDFGIRTKIELLYERLPLLVLGAKFMLGKKLKDLPTQKALVIGALDLIEAHRRELFVDGDLGPVADAIAALVKTAAPEISGKDRDALRAAVLEVLSTTRSKAQAGTLAESDLLALVKTVLNDLPGDLAAGLPETFDLQSILESLGDTNDPLAQDQAATSAIAAILGPDASLQDLIKELTTARQDAQ